MSYINTNIFVVYACLYLRAPHEHVEMEGNTDSAERGGGECLFVKEDVCHKY